MSPKQVLLELRKTFSALGVPWPERADPIALGLLQQLCLHPPSVEDRLLAFFREAGGSTTLTHQEIAEEIGSSRERVSKILKELDVSVYRDPERGVIWSLRRREDLTRLENGRLGARNGKGRPAKVKPSQVRLLFVGGIFRGTVDMAGRRLGVSDTTACTYFHEIGAQLDRAGHCWRLPAERKVA